MRGIIKLHVHQRFQHTERYIDAEQRDGIIRRWVADFNLTTKPHYITIIPDHEEIERAYEIEHTEGLSCGCPECGDHPGIGEAREETTGEIREAV